MGLVFFFVFCFIRKIWFYNDLYLNPEDLHSNFFQILWIKLLPSIYSLYRLFDVLDSDSEKERNYSKRQIIMLEDKKSLSEEITFIVETTSKPNFWSAYLTKYFIHILFDFIRFWRSEQIVFFLQPWELQLYRGCIFSFSFLRIIWFKSQQQN